MGFAPLDKQIALVVDRVQTRLVKAVERDGVEPLLTTAARTGTALRPLGYDSLSLGNALDAFKVAQDKLPAAYGETNATRRAAEAVREELAKPYDPMKLPAIDGALKDDRILLNGLQLAGPDRLRIDGEMRGRYTRLTDSVQRRMDGQIQNLLGVKPEGAPKNVDRAVDKLVFERKADPNMRLGDLDDLTRGRINLNAYKPTEMRDMLKKLREHFGDENIHVNDYMRGRKFYRGRLHVKIKDQSGMWYELQIGPRQLSTFFDTPFRLGHGQSNLHDAVYKGVLRLDLQGLKAIGAGSLSIGRARQEGILKLYKSHLDAVMADAQVGESYDFNAESNDLVSRLRAVTRALPPTMRPVGLKGT